ESDEQRRQERGPRHLRDDEHHIAHELDGAVGGHRKLRSSDPTTRFHPSAKTKRSSLMGKLSVIGDTNTMPIDMSREATARSTTRNGSSTMTPIWNDVVSSERTKAGIAIVMGTSSGVFGRAAWVTP